jgi:hypothetical protein
LLSVTNAGASAVQPMVGDTEGNSYWARSLEITFQAAGDEIGIRWMFVPAVTSPSGSRTSGTAVWASAELVLMTGRRSDQPEHSSDTIVIRSESGKWMTARN